MGIFLSITNSSNELTKSQKLYRLTESNEVIELHIFLKF